MQPAKTNIWAWVYHLGEYIMYPEKYVSCLDGATICFKITLKTHYKARARVRERGA
jgi:hypothetical protein